MFYLSNLGGWNITKSFDTIVKFDEETENWIVDETPMLHARNTPAVSVVKYSELEEYCQP